MILIEITDGVVLLDTEPVNVTEGKVICPLLGRILVATIDDDVVEISSLLITIPVEIIVCTEVEVCSLLDTALVGTADIVSIFVTVVTVCAVFSSVFDTALVGVDGTDVSSLLNKVLVEVTDDVEVNTALLNVTEMPSLTLVEESISVEMVSILLEATLSIAVDVA